MSKTKTKNKLQPDFPEWFTDKRSVWGQGNDLYSLQILASIPYFAMHPIGSKEREKLEAEFWEEKQKEYERLKETYEKYVFKGVIWKGNTSASCEITKIHIDDKKAYVCSKPSLDHIKEVEEYNQKYGTDYKPCVKTKFGLNTFLSAIQSNAITILKTPEL